MGQKHLLVIPQTRQWDQVVALLGQGAAVDDVAAASSVAAERVLARASDDKLLNHAVWLLSQIPQAARSDNFEQELRSLGLDVRPDPSLMEVVSAFMGAMDAKALRVGRQSDLAEMAQCAAADSLTALVGRELPGLFGADGQDVRNALAGLGTPGRFSVLARDFFSRLTYRCLTYYLSRELSNHVGPGRRFDNSRDHSVFKEALDRHCRESARIIREFSSSWYSKRLFEQGRINEDDARTFTHVAFKKIREELRRGREDA